MNQDSKVENKVSEEDKKKNAKAIIIFVVFAILAWFVFGSGSSVKQTTSNSMDDIYKKVSTDAVDQYRIAERQGDKMQICVQAGLVSAAYLQAKDEYNYQTWKITEKRVCQQAGLPQ